MATVNAKRATRRIRNQRRILARQPSGRFTDELAMEIDRLNRAVLDNRERLDFNDEPSRFIALLLAHRWSAAK